MTCAACHHPRSCHVGPGGLLGCCWADDGDGKPWCPCERFEAEPDPLDNWCPEGCARPAAPAGRGAL